jgi:predicted acyl esterase
MRARTFVAFLATALLVSVLAFGAAPTPSAVADGGGIIPGLDEADPLPEGVTVSPGVEQVTMRGATPRHPYTIVDETGERLLTLYSDDLGQLTFAYLPEDYLVFDPNEGGILPTSDGRAVQPGTYQLVDEEAAPIQASDQFEVVAVDDVAEPEFYEQDITADCPDIATTRRCFTYVETRDGEQLSVMIRWPAAEFAGLWGFPVNGPFPTVVEYSGYSPSNPNGTGEPGSMIANLMGFASVGVNIRGTGCSGGVFDVFNGAQRADGYDAIETVAAEDWVAYNEVGMVGLSYSGILQLYAASTNPPSLAAITPLSTIEDPWDQQWPGGIYNTGFTQEWLAERDRQAGGDVGWVRELIDDTDDTDVSAEDRATCADNLLIRSQNLDFEEFGASLERRPLDADARNLSTLVQNIHVPVYQSGGWQDEQTGSQFGDLLDEYINAPVTKFRVYNGRHPDGYTPVNLSRWLEHLTFYVKREVPEIPPLVRAAAPALLGDFFGVQNLEFEPDRFADLPDYETAEQAYRDTPDVEVLWDFGAGRTDNPPDGWPFEDEDPDDGIDPNCTLDFCPGAPLYRSSSTFESWPPPSTEWRRYLGPDGTLLAEPPADADVQRYRYDGEGDEIAYADASGGDFIKPQLDFDWQPMAEGDGLSFLSEPLEDMTVIAGDGYVDLWFRSEGTDAAIEVVLTEVYPSGEEVIVQHGLLRAGYPELDPADSAGTTRRHLYYEENYAPLVPGEVRNIQVPIYPVAHPFREGSQLRLSINTPGRDDPIWSYVTDGYGATFQEVSFGGDTPSSLVLPLVSGVESDIDPTVPFCNSLRGQPCRDYVPVVNTQGCASTRFSDLAWDNPFCLAISELAAAGVIEGDQSGTVRPTSAVSRQAMAAFLYRAAGSPDGDDPTCTTAAFSDVPADHAFCGEIAWAVDEGIVNGFPSGEFRPTLAVSRQAMAGFLYRSAGSPNGPGPTCTEPAFPDVPADNPFCGEIDWAVEAGITTGFEDGTFRPLVAVSRQAMAAFLTRLP